MTMQTTGSLFEPSSQRAPGRDVMARLKAETATEHRAIEAASNIMDEGLSLSEYRAYLEKFYGFQLAVEGPLCRFGVWEALGLPAEERAKLPLLARDLTGLDGGTPASVKRWAAPTCWKAPRSAGASSRDTSKPASARPHPRASSSVMVQRPASAGKPSARRCRASRARASWRIR
jgi:hypothetical protein